jgi:hypothetical protein
MIVFELICEAEHRFEGWFGSAEIFEGQLHQGLLTCPVCSSYAIRKLLTAKIGRSERKPESVKAPVLAPQVSDNAMLSSIIDHVLLTTEDVGENFAFEARRMSIGEVPVRAIRGEASSSEADALRDEGIPVFSIPIPSKGKWS